jgi:hypothetical protein
LQSYFALKESFAIECGTVEDLIERAQVQKIDFFKTDLEGLDYEVLVSAPELVSRSLCVQCELRFQPVFEGEPAFHEVAGYLASLGLELIHLRPEVWKYNTPGRSAVRDGRTVWTDALFFLSPEKVRQRFQDAAWKAFAKQVILARLHGLSNFAQFLFQETSAGYPPSIQVELGRFVQPSFNLSFAAAKAISRFPGGRLILEAMRRVCASAYLTSALFKDEVIGAERPR